MSGPATELRSTRRIRWTARAWVRPAAECGRELAAPLLGLLAALFLQRLAALVPALTERYYTHSLYPHVVVALSAISRRFDFSVAEIAISLLLVAAACAVARLCALLYLRRQGRLRRAVASVRFALWCAAACFWAFLLCFGLNYQRPLLFDLLGFERRQASAPELEMIAGEIVRSVNASYEEAHAQGRVAPSANEITRLLEESYSSAPALSLLPRGVYVAPKPIHFSGLLTRLGLGGLYFPFTGEPNYNRDQPDFQLPFTMAHEMAHQRGVARESEANFVAYLICTGSRDPFVRYSGYRNGLGVLAWLYRSDPEKARELYRQLGPGYREDSRRAALFWSKSAGATGALGRRVNDLYLKANRVRSGAADYAAATALIVGYYLHGK